MKKTIWGLVRKKPWFIMAAFFVVIVQAVMNVAEVLLLEGFVDGFDRLKWNQSAFFAILFSGIYAFYYLQKPLMEYLKNSICLQFRSCLEQEMIEETVRISPAVLENSKNQALLKRLQDKPENRCANGVFAILQIVGGILGAIGVVSLVVQATPFFLPMFFLMIALMIVVFRAIGNQRVTMYRARQEISRRGDYLSGILFDRRLAQEKKLFGYTSYIQKLYREENIESGNQMLRQIFLSNGILWFYDNITYFFSASAYLILLFPLYRGEIDVGQYIAVIPALARIGRFFVSVGSNYLPAYKEYQACMEDMKTLADLPKQYYVSGSNPDEKEPTFQVICGENIVFRYPGQEKPILNGLNFTFYAGKNYALVGENGCGKTTLMKLLLGIYQPESGRILIDGEDIRNMEFGRLQKYFSSVFQDFARYDYTIKENICMSALGIKEQEARMKSVIQDVKLNDWIMACPDGYDTKLGNLEDGGIDLSGGQWQRLSIARMLYRPACIYIWDEPTAAMDPIAESQLYTDYQQKHSDKCANIFVTHRLGAAVCADEICVMADGQFVEQGSHVELMKEKDGLYCKMFEAQKGMYL